MKNSLLLLLTLLLPAQAFFAQTNLLPPPATQRLATSEVTNGFKNVAGPSAFSLTEVLDYTFDSIRALTPLKGLNAALRLPDGTYWKRAAGVAAETPVPVPLTTQHLMGMGSISKSFVAVTLLRLQEEGLLSLDDSIGQYLPAYPNIAGAATVRQLLSHRTGFNDYLNENPAMFDAFAANLDSIWVTDTVLNHFVLAPNFPLGTDWSYSNTNFLLAGRVIEVVTGQPWYQVVRAQVLNPLGLTHTFIYPWETPEGQPFSHFFADLTGAGNVDDWQGLGLPDQGLFSLASSAGCLISNPEDLSQFSAQVYGGNLLQPASLLQMETNFTPPGAGFEYGLGSASFPLGIPNWGHDGDLIYKSVALYFPTENIALAVQQNDDRTADPADPNAPEYDVYGLFAALLDAYLNYSPMVPTTDLQSGQNRLICTNPVHEVLDVSIPGVQQSGSIQIITAAGELALQDLTTWTEGSTTVRLPVGSLQPGMYTLLFRGSNGLVLSRRFVKID